MPAGGKLWQAVSWRFKQCKAPQGNLWQPISWWQYSLPASWKGKLCWTPGPPLGCVRCSQHCKPRHRAEKREPCPPTPPHPANTRTTPTSRCYQRRTHAFEAPWNCTALNPRSAWCICALKCLRRGMAPRTAPELVAGPPSASLPDSPECLPGGLHAQPATTSLPG